MKKRKMILCLNILITLLIMWFLQILLMPKYMTASKEGSLIGEYYENAGNNDVIFIGDCEVYENFSPVTLWKEYGITSYIRGSAQQMIWQSYYLMEETFQYDAPKAIIFNVLTMKYDTPMSTGNSDQREAYNRMTLDSMRWSGSKWNSVLASLTDEEKKWEAQYTYIFPLLRYHDRWSQLTEEDFTFLFKKETISDNGYLMQTGIQPLITEHAEPPLADYSFGENSWYYLDKMVELCKKNNTELILIKAPSLSPVWWEQWDEQIMEYAAENDLLYINMLNHLDEIGIDWNTDTYDTGLHLNVYGAEKAASWLGEILVDECNIPDRRRYEFINNEWSKKVEIYNRRKELLESENYN